MNQLLVKICIRFILAKVLSTLFFWNPAWWIFFLILFSSIGCGSFSNLKNFSESLVSLVTQLKPASARAHYYLVCRRLLAKILWEYRFFSKFWEKDFIARFLWSPCCSDGITEARVHSVIRRGRCAVAATFAWTLKLIFAQESLIFAFPPQFLSKNLVFAEIDICLFSLRNCPFLCALWWDCGFTLKFIALLFS